MSKEEIVKNNRIIAEFMGMKFVPDSEDIHGGEWMPVPKHSNWCFDSPPPFNLSWSWLMPVVEKIRSLSTPTPKGMNIDHVIVHIKLIEATIPFCQIVYTDRLLSQWVDKKQPILLNTYRFNNAGIDLKESIYNTILQFINWYNTDKLS